MRGEGRDRASTTNRPRAVPAGAHRLALVLAVAAAWLSALRSAPAAPGPYTAIDLGTLGGSTSRAYALDDAAVVGASETASGQTHAFRWLRSTRAMTDLGTFGGPDSAAYGINARGQVVGAAQTASGAWHAFVWESGVMTDLGVLFGGRESFAYGINDDGVVVGAADLRVGYDTGYVTDYGLHAVAWRPRDGKFVIQDFGTLGANHGRALAINATGKVAGATYVLAGTGNVVSGAAWWANGIVAPLGTVADGPASHAEGIDARGRIAGVTDVSFTGLHAVVWDNDLPTVLPDPPGCVASVAYGIADGGLVVGSASAKRLQGSGPWQTRYDGDRAVVWDGGKVLELSAVVTNAADWHLRVARAVSRAGRIAGWGLKAGRMHAFLLEPGGTAEARRPE